MSNQLIDSRQLQAFVTLARTGSFTRTAQELFLTQSAVSHSIKALEQDMDCALFSRAGKRALLTEAGERLLPVAATVLESMRRARGELLELADRRRGRLRIGASVTTCEHLLPGVLRSFRHRFPDYRIAIEPADSPGLLRLLLDNRVDLAVMLAPEGAHGCTYRPLFSDELQLMVHPDHRWARRGAATPGELAAESFVLYNRESTSFKAINAYFRREGIDLKNTIELSSVEAIKALVRAGLGAGVLAPWVTERELAQKQLVSLPLGRRKLYRRWGLCHLKGRRLSDAEEVFVGLCEDAAADLVRARPFLPDAG